MSVTSLKSNLNIKKDDITWGYCHASGPGGQHVNKTATAVLLRFNIYGQTIVSEEIRRRLMQIAKNRITTDGILVIDARRFKSQKRNREDALKRLELLIKKAATPPVIRKKTKPGKATRRRRLDAKRRRSQLKRQRRPVNTLED